MRWTMRPRYLPRRAPEFQPPCPRRRLSACFTRSQDPTERSTGRSWSGYWIRSWKTVSVALLCPWMCMVRTRQESLIATYRIFFWCTEFAKPAYASHAESQQYASNNYAANQGDDGAAPDIIGMLCAALCAGINSGSGNASSNVPASNGGGGGYHGGANGGTDHLDSLIQVQPTPTDFGKS